MFIWLTSVWCLYASAASVPRGGYMSTTLPFSHSRRSAMSPKTVLLNITKRSANFAPVLHTDINIEWLRLQTIPLEKSPVPRGPQASLLVKWMALGVGWCLREVNMPDGQCEALRLLQELLAVPAVWRRVAMSVCPLCLSTSLLQTEISQQHSCSTGDESEWLHCF